MARRRGGRGLMSGENRSVVWTKCEERWRKIGIQEDDSKGRKAGKKRFREEKNKRKKKKRHLVS